MKNIFIIFFIILFTSNVQAQLEKIIVEPYYISDSADASDTTNGFLETGSTTYRIYVDLKPGYKLTKVFGNAQHNLKIASTETFFNAIDGQTFGFNTDKNFIIKNDVYALDTWLTMGQAYAKKGKTTGWGIIKTQEKDSSIIKLLTNADPKAGIPLTTADGYYHSSSLPNVQVSHFGILDEFTNEDSTIFGSIRLGKEFNSNGKDVNLSAALSGVKIIGVVPDSNQVLIAQLTTKGKLSFELNLEIQDAAGTIYTYVAKPGTDPNSTNIVSNDLTYPGSCGCMDPHYLEYNNSFICELPQACKTLIVCGCTDSFACNYDPNANVNIPALCCYPGFCNNRDIAVVCPGISNNVEFTLFPNPAIDYLMLKVSGVKENDEIKYSVYDSYGVFKQEGSKTTTTDTYTERIDITSLPVGLYSLRVSAAGVISSKLFMVGL